MAAPADRVRPSADQLAFTGRVWKRALAHQADALMLLAAKYTLAEQFRLIPWEDLGYELQCDMALELSKFLEITRKAARA